MDAFMSTNATYCYVVPSELQEDERQEAYLAILTENPQSEEDALCVLRKLHHRYEWKERRWKRASSPLVVDPPAEQRESGDGRMMTALQSLSTLDRELIDDNIIDGATVRQIALRSGSSKSNVQRRCSQAIEKLRSLTK